MAPPKKNDEDKAKRLNFTIPPALYSAFHQKCRDEGKEISKTLQSLIEMYLNDSMCIDTHQIHTPQIDGSVLSVIQSMQSRIDKLEQEKERAITPHQIHTQSTLNIIPAPVTEPAPEPITQKAGIVVSPVTPMEVSPEPITVNSVPGKVTSGEVKIIGQGLIAFRQKTGMDVKKQMREYFGCDISHMKKWSEGDNAKAPGRDKYNMIMSKLKEAGVV
jgi:hypothetical protein